MKTPTQIIADELAESKRSVGKDLRSGLITEDDAFEEMGSLNEKMYAAKKAVLSVQQKSVADIEEMLEEADKDFLLISRSTSVSFKENFSTLNRLAGTIHGLKLAIEYRTFCDRKPVLDES